MIIGRNINEEIVLDVVSAMSTMLDGETLIKLKNVLYMKLIKYDISTKETEYELSTIDNDNTNLKVLMQFKLSKELDGKSLKTTQRYEDMLKPVLLDVNKPLSKITTDDLQQYLWNYKATRGVSNSTLDGMRRIMSSFFSWCRIKKYIADNLAEGLQKIKCEKKVKQIITDEELERIRINCKNDRDIAMIDLLYASGIRVGELSNLDISDVDFVNKSILVHGKGNKQRTVYFDGRTKVRLEKYLSTRTDNNPALFVTLLNDRHTLQPRRFTIRGIELRIKQIGLASGIINVFPHKFRSKCATDLCRKGMSIEKVAKILGHEKLETTRIYAEVAEIDTRNAYLQYVG
jgi:site-specific recombinase XerD